MRHRLLVPVAALGAVVVCAGAPAAGGRISGYGISIVLPPSWDGAITRQHGLPVLRASDGGTRLLLAEVGNRPGTQGFERASLPIRLAAPPRRVADRRFAVNGRSFFVRADLAARTELRVVNRILATLRIRRVGTPPAVWRRLASRPLRPLAPGPCRRSPSSRAAAAVNWVLGRGPAYPSVGSRNAVASLRHSIRLRGRYAIKVLWAVAPREPGPILVHGRGLRFGATPASRRLQLRPDPFDRRRRWRYYPTTAWVRTPGCYAFQVEGLRFSRLVVFEARM